MADRMTACREAILRVLSGTASHPDARSVYEQVQEVLPGVSLSTVYRTLAWLRDRGLVLEFPTPRGARYDANVREHHHVTCRSCGRIEDLDLTVDGPLAAAVRHPRFAVIEGARVELTGLCADCAAREQQ
jgi:Fe2+ or Zn2+ uptake regulation protein